MRSLLYFLLSVFVIFTSSCESSIEERKLKITLVQINDVYEIAAVSNGTIGGYARLAYLVDSLKKTNPNTLLVHAGDFLSPSLIGNLKDENGTRIRGRHMIEVMNSAGIDVVTFGNHEFDIKEEELKKRIDESNFQWISSNVYQKSLDGKVSPFSQRGEPVPAVFYKEFVADRDTFRMALIGTTLPFNKKSFVHYSEVDQSLRSVLDTLDVDRAFLLSHLERNQDRAIAKQFQTLPLIMGGHDHYHFIDTVGEVLVSKADANLRSVWKHELTYDFESEILSIASELIVLDETIGENDEVLKLVNRWLDFASRQANKSGFNIDEVLWEGDSIWECHETVIRSKQTNFGAAVAHSMKAFSGADLALLNSGSLRYDDRITDRITTGDLLKALPFGGALWTTTIRGSELAEIIRIGMIDNQGTGGYLQIPNVEIIDGQVFLNQKKLDLNDKYKICATGFLASGKEAYLKRLADLDWKELPSTENSPNEIRHVVIRFFKNYQ